MTVVGTTAYVANVSGLEIIDISNPTTPALLGSYARGIARGVTVVGTTAYVASHTYGLQIFDTSDCPPCLADFTNDGVVDFFDVSAFLSAYGTSDPIADFTDDGIFDFFDVSAFLQAFATGCP